MIALNRKSGYPSALLMMAPLTFYLPGKYGTTFFVQQDICQLGHLFEGTFPNWEMDICKIYYLPNLT